MLSYFVGVFALSTILLTLLYQVKNTKSSFLKRAFLVYSGKSNSGAQLLGGLPVGLSVIFGVLVLKLFQIKMALNLNMTLSFLIASTIILSYGYFDDRFELRPIVKLFCQTFSVLLFTAISAIDIGNDFSTIFFIFMAFYGIGVVNGTNLLDGLDLMTVKISSVVYGSYILISYLYGSDITMTYSLICLASLLPFSFYNKFPSKIHLGEIGGAYIGFTYMLLSASVFRDIFKYASFIDSFALAVFPMSISMVEVGISFLRRILNHKSPFKGDRFHIHHILRNYNHFSINKTTNLLALTYACILGGTIYLTTVVNIKFSVSYILSVLFLFAFQYQIGKKQWVKKKFDFSLKNFLTSLRKEHVVVIDSSKVDSFEFKIVSHEAIDNQNEKDIIKSETNTDESEKS